VSALSTMKHADGCRCVRENGVAIWMCVGECPAMYEFIASGQCDNQPWDQGSVMAGETTFTGNDRSKRGGNVARTPRKGRRAKRNAAAFAK
jgi:hypothetical protein